MLCPASRNTILAPTALAPNDDLFPCSEFIGLPAFSGGKLFRDDLDDVLQRRHG